MLSASYIPSGTGSAPGHKWTIAICNTLSDLAEFSSPYTSHTGCILGVSVHRHCQSTGNLGYFFFSLKENSGSCKDDWYWRIVILCWVWICRKRAPLTQGTVSLDKSRVQARACTLYPWTLDLQSSNLPRIFPGLLLSSWNPSQAVTLASGWGCACLSSLPAARGLPVLVWATEALQVLANCSDTVYALNRPSWGLYKPAMHINWEI